MSDRAEVNSVIAEGERWRSPRTTITVGAKMGEGEGGEEEDKDEDKEKDEGLGGGGKGGGEREGKQDAQAGRRRRTIGRHLGAMKGCFSS